MRLDFRLLGLVALALAVGFYVGRETAGPFTAVQPSHAFRSIDHCLAYYAETITTDDAVDLAWQACNNLVSQ